MNTCPVYRRSGGLSYGATYSGPIGIILDPTFDMDEYSELPFHSSLCGSCTEICPVHINISDQILEWRKVMMEKKKTPFGRRLAFALTDQIMGNSKLFKWMEGTSYNMVSILPESILKNSDLDPWVEDREIPDLQKETFRDWYKKNRENND